MSLRKPSIRLGQRHTTSRHSPAIEVPIPRKIESDPLPDLLASRKARSYTASYGKKKTV